MTETGQHKAARLLQVTIDCRDPQRLVDFWHAVLDYEVPPAPTPHATWRDYYVSTGVPPDSIQGDGRDRLRPRAGQHGVKIWFQFVPEEKSGKNRFHFDLKVTSGAAAAKSDRRTAIGAVINGVIAHGGSLVAWHESPVSQHIHAVVADPEGNEFCLA